MIKTIDLMAQVFHETDKQLIELDNQKNNMPAKEYKKRLKEILSQRKKQLKEIEKKYPLEREVEKYLKEG